MPKNKKILKNAQYSIPVSEHAPGAEKRMTRRGTLKKAFKYTDQSNTSGRIPLSTVAKTPMGKKMYPGAEGPKVSAKKGLKPRKSL